MSDNSLISLLIGIMFIMLMEMIQTPDKQIYKIPFDTSHLLDCHSCELPSHINLELSESEIYNYANETVIDGVVFILNFIDCGIKINGSIKGSMNGQIKEKKFNLKPKDNCSFYGWKYSNTDEIELNVSAEILTGDEIPLVENMIIPLPARSKHLIFYC